MKTQKDKPMTKLEEDIDKIIDEDGIMEAEFNNEWKNNVTKLLLSLFKREMERVIGEDEKIMSKKEVDETYKKNEGNVSYGDIMDIGIQRRLDRNDLRREQRKRLEALLQ